MFNTSPGSGWDFCRVITEFRISNPEMYRQYWEHKKQKQRTVSRGISQY